MRIGVPSHPGFAATGGRPWSRAAETIVFVHGAGMDHTVWSLPARHFAHAGRAVLAPDLPVTAARAAPRSATSAPWPTG